MGSPAAACAFAAPTAPGPGIRRRRQGRAGSTSTPTASAIDERRGPARGSTSSSSRRRGRTSGSAPTPAATSRPPASTSAGASSTSTTSAGASAATRRSSTTWSASPARCPTCAARSRPTSAGDRLSREQVLACAVRLLDRGFFRIGSEDYAVTNETYGLATMKKRHVPHRGDALLFDYPAKHGKRRLQPVVDPEVAEIVSEAEARRGGGDELLAYKEGGRWRRRPVRRHQRLPEGRDRPRRLGQGLPHLGRDRARRRRPRGVEPRRLSPTKRKRADHARGQGGRLLPGQHARGRPRLLHRPARLRPLPRRRSSITVDHVGGRRGRHRDPGPGRGGRARPHHGRERLAARRASGEAA